MTFSDRCVRAFLGLALGDAFGRPPGGEPARTVPPDPERLVGTDDTRASLHLAEVVLGHGRDALVDETFGAAVARDVAARGETWVAVADLHGHPAALDALIAWCDAHLGPEYRLATLGDYCDNGPDVPGLLDRLVRLSDERGDRFVPILGNHDLACLRAMADEGWYEQWSRLYWNAGGATPAAYGARSGAELARRMPAAHRAFLASLPWFHDTGRYLFVHAGLAPGPIEPQLAPLRERRLPAERLHLPPPIRDKSLSRVADPAWERVVVSGHNKHLGGPRFVGPNRICLSAEIDATGVLHAVVLPERRWLAVGRGGTVVVEPRVGAG